MIDPVDVVLARHRGYQSASTGEIACDDKEARSVLRERCERLERTGDSHHGSAAQEDMIVGQFTGVAKRGGRQDDRAAVLRSRAERLRDAAHRARVNPDERFLDEQDAHLRRRERLDECNASRLGAGE
jgi:hypothetical protein